MDGATVVIAESHRISKRCPQTAPEVHPIWGVEVCVAPAVPQCSKTIVPPTHEGSVGKDPARLSVAGGKLVVVKGERCG